MEYCDRHHHLESSDESQTKAIAATDGKEATLKWGFGIFLTVFLFIAGLGTTVISGKMTDMTNELKEIKSAVHSIAIDQVQVKTELDSLRWRVEQLEAR